MAVVLDRAAAAAEIRAAWDDREAVAVLDPAAPAAVLERLVARLRPTHVVDGDGRHPRADGVPVAEDVRAVVLTSGTTANPKAVELTAAGLDASGAGGNAALGLERDDRWLVCLPLHHVAGLAILARAAVGGHEVTVHPSFDLAAVADSPRREDTTVVSVVPTMLGRLLDAGAPLHDYRRVVVGGAPLPPALRRQAESLGVAVVDAYGLSETWGGFVLDGVPIPGADVIVGPDAEIRVRGPMVFRGYRSDAEATAAAFDTDGWFRTGDIGDWGDEGRLRLVDRRRDVVISGGVNVSPTAVESVLAEHPDIADVCVTGTPDPQWGERVVAFVVPRAGASVPTVEELRAFGRDRLRAPELPRQVVAIAAIPRTAGGKAQRRRLPPPD
ncbi:MAG TPA: fatty acid--CoA ligase family protein [Acidimicrobiia bacterium]|nr:fatty acid--CoA ligase family protein [Acidimicrobiia bacterium]